MRDAGLVAVIGIVACGGASESGESESASTTTSAS
jgi:hypothetical protein